MGYYVKYKELQEAQANICNQINQWSEELYQVKSQIQVLLEMEEIKGNTADSIKNYMLEVHIPLIAAIQKLLTEYLIRLILYGDDYYEIDTMLNAKIAQDRLDEQLVCIHTKLDTFQTIQESVRGAIGSIAGLANVYTPSGETIEDSYENLQKKANDLMHTVGDCEYGHLRSDFITMEEMLSNLTQLINGQSGKSYVTIMSYQAGSLSELPAYQRLQEATEKQAKELNAKAGKLQDAIERYSKKQQERSLAEEREKKGRSQIFQGVLIAVGAVIGAVAIVATFGTATPVVVGAFALGSASGLYGLSNMEEGIDNVILAHEGDITTNAINPIRDTIFLSNPELYYTIGEASTITCAVIAPLGGASTRAIQAGTSVSRALTIEGGKIALSTVAGASAAELVYQQTENEMLALLTGMGAGGLLYGGMNRVDAITNISGYYSTKVPQSVAANSNLLKNQVASVESKEGIYRSLFGEMSEVDAVKYSQFLKEGSKAGMTNAELQALARVEEQLALKRVDYSEVLKLRNQGGSSKGDSISTVTKLTSAEVKAAIMKNGISVDEFSKLLNPNKILNPDELILVDKVRADIGLPQAGTIMNKTIPQRDIYNYLYNENYSGVRGFVSVDEHSSALKTLYDVFEGNRLDYNNTAFKIGNGVDGVSQSVGNADTVFGKITYVLEDANAIKVPTDLATAANAPYTARGFTGSKNIVLPELVQDSRKFITGDILSIYDSVTGKEVSQFIYDKKLGTWILKE